MSKNYFYHGGMLLSEDELMHWKYVSKKRVNGKWVYVYDVKKVNDIKKERETTQAKTSGLIQEYHELAREEPSFKVKYDPAYKKKGVKTTPEEFLEYERYQEYESKMSAKSKEINESSRKASKLGDELATAKWERLAANGLNVVESILSKFKKKKK